MKESVVDGDCLVTKTRYRGEDSWAYVHGLRSIGMRLCWNGWNLTLACFSVGTPDGSFHCLILVKTFFSFPFGLEGTHEGKTEKLYYPSFVLGFQGFLRFGWRHSGHEGTWLDIGLYPWVGPHPLIEGVGVYSVNFSTVGIVITGRHAFGAL